MIQDDFARIRNEHRKSYPSSGDEAWDRYAVCDACDLPFPCTTIQLVDEIERLTEDRDGYRDAAANYKASRDAADAEVARDTRFIAAMTEARDKARMEREAATTQLTLLKDELLNERLTIAAVRLMAEEAQARGRKAEQQTGIYMTIVDAEQLLAVLDKEETP